MTDSRTTSPTDPMPGEELSCFEGNTAVDRLKNALTAQCLPQKLTRDVSGEVPCLVLATLGEPGPQTRCAELGLRTPEPDVLARFRQDEAERTGGASADGALPVCELPQVPQSEGTSCGDVTSPVWCYVENQPPCSGGMRPQQLLFSQGADALKGARYDLQCIQQFGAGVSGTAPSARP